MLGITFGAMASASSNAQTWPTWNGTKDGTPVQFEPGSVTGVTNITSTKVDTDKTFVAYKYNNTLKGVIISTAGNVVSVGTAVTIAAVSTSDSECCTMDTGRVMVTYGDNASNVKAVILSVSGTTLTVNTAVTVDNSGNWDGVSAVVFLNTNRCVLVYSILGTAKAVTLTGASTTITVNSVFSGYNTGSPDDMTACTMDTSHVFVAFGVASSTNGRAVVLSISGDTITAPTADEQFTTVRASGSSMTITSLDSTHAILSTVETSTNNGIAYAFSISGTTITNGLKATFDSGGGVGISFTEPSISTINSTTCLTLYRVSNTMYGMVMTTSGTTITSYTRVSIASTGISQRGLVTLDSNRLLASYGDNGTPNLGFSVVLSIV